MLGRVTNSLLDKRMTLPVVMVLSLLPCTPAAAQSVRERLPQEFQLARAGLVRQWFSRASLDPLRNRVGAVALIDGRLYVQTTGGMIQSLDGETGRQLWVAQVGRPSKDIIPVSANSTSLFVVNATDLYMLDTQTGEHLWHTMLEHAPSASATATETELFVPMFTGQMDVYNIKDRRIDWYYATGSRLLSQPIVTLGNVAFANDLGNLYVTRRDQRSLVFRYETDAPISAPLIKQGDEWIVLASEDFNVYCVHAMSGRTRWRFSAEAPILTAPVSVGDMIYILPEHRGMFQIDAETGIERWRSPHPTRFVAASPDRLYGTDPLGNLVILDRDTGNLVGALDTNAFELAAVNTENDRIYLISQSGLIICLREYGLDEPAAASPAGPEPPLPDAETEEETTP